MPSGRSRQKTSRVPHSTDLAAQATHNRHDRPPSRSNEDARRPLPTLEPPINWPPSVKYLSHPIQSPYLTEQQTRWLHTRPQPAVGANEAATPVIKLPLSRTQIDSTIEIRLINDENHPAYRQHGLFAACSLAPGDLIVPYIGYVHSSTASENAVRDTLETTQEQRRQEHTAADQPQDQGPTSTQSDQSEEHYETRIITAPPVTIDIGSWDTSSYDLNLHRDGAIELAIDAARLGNEARFCNDYRGVPVQSITNTTDTKWDRRQKRSAKSWNTNDYSAGIEGDFVKPEVPMAIPNAEFRDVWFEWAGEDDVVDGNDATIDAQNGLKGLSMNENKPETKQSRRKRRRKNVGMRGVAIFVMPAGRAGKRKEGVKARQEILVSYGKGFWAHHGVESSDVSQTESHQAEASI